MKLQAKVYMRAYLEENEYYEIIEIHNDRFYLVSCGIDNKQTIIFSKDEKYHKESVPYTVQVEMYVWDYFYKPIKLLRKEKLKRIEN